MIEYAKRYGVLEWIPKENINIIVEEDAKLFLEAIHNEKICIFFRYLR